MPVASAPETCSARRERTDPEPPSLPVAQHAAPHPPLDRPVAALQDLRAFVAARCRRATRPLADRIERAARHFFTGRAELDARLLRAKLELEPMDPRTPPSENIGSAVLPLAMTAAAMTAALYFAQTLEAHELNAGAGATGAGGGNYDTTPALMPAVTLGADDFAGGAPGADPTGRPLTVGPAPAVDEVLGAGGAVADGAGSTLQNLLDDEFARYPVGGPGGGGGGDPGTGDGVGDGAGAVGGGAPLGGAGEGAGPNPPGGNTGGGSVGGLDGGFGFGGTGPNGFFPQPEGGGAGAGAGGPGLAPNGADPSGSGGASGAGAGGASGSGGASGGASSPNGGNAGGAGANGSGGTPDGSGLFGAVENRGGTALVADTSTQPVRFVANAGQWADGTDFAVRGDGFQVALARASATVALARTPTPDERADRGAGTVFDALTLEWTGASPEARATGEGRLDSVSNFLTGKDPNRWHTNVAEFGAVRYADLWAGVDLLYHRADAGGIEYDLVVKPGASAQNVGFTVRGADARVDELGRLVLTTPAGTELVQSAPVLYQTGADGARATVAGTYRLRADGSVGFEVGAHDATRALVIDPVLSYGAAFGGSATDVATGVAADADGNAFAVGYTQSSDFPTSGAYDATRASAQDAFVTKLDPTGAVVWSTYLGGTGTVTQDRANGVALRPSDGAVFLTGATDSADFPTAGGPYQAALAGGSDAFLAALSADGSALLYSSYLGSPQADHGTGVAVDPATGEAVVAGWTEATDVTLGGPSTFPTTSGAFQTASGGGTDAFVTRFTAAGSALAFGTLLGGSGDDKAFGVALDRTGAAAVVGQTGSADFPTVAAFDTTLGGTTDAFVARFTAAGTVLGATLYGGSGNEAGTAVAVDRTDRIAVTGTTTSTDLPVRFPVQGASGGGQDAFVARFTALASAPEFATYQGGAGTDAGFGIATDPSSRAIVAGTDGTGLTVTRYSPHGTAVEWSAAGASGSTGYAAAAVGDAVYAAGTDGADALVLGYGPVPAPVITAFADDTGASNSDRLTGDATPTVGGTAPAGATVAVYSRAAAAPAPVLLGTAAVAGGLWTYTLAVAADGTYGLTATAAVAGGTSAPSAPLTFTLDTAGPDVSVAVASQTYDRRPPITVTASDLYGVGTTVALDVDLDGDNTFTDPGETDFATGTLVNGALTFDAYTTYLTVGVTAHARARVLDAAGNEGTSPVKSVTVNASPNTWVATGATADVRGGYGGASGWTTAADALLYAGDVTTQYALDLDLSTTAFGWQNPALVYHSQEAAPAPVVQSRVLSDNALGVPSQVLGTLTWDGVVAGTISYDTAALSPGGEWVFAARPTTGLGTGRHTYALDLFIDYPGAPDDVNRSATGQTFLVDRSDSAYGAGWSFSGTDALVTVASSGSYPAGVLRLYGGGGWSFYADAGSGQYTEPPGDAGALVAGGGAWTYTAWDGKVLAFDSSGRMTTRTSADGTETLTYTYDGASAGTAARVATATGPDGGVGTFAYATGLLATVAAPGGRTTTFALSGTDLVAITDPTAATGTFAYSAHRLTGETARGVNAAYTYADGLARTVQVGTDPVGTISAALGTGLAAAATAAVQGVGGAKTSPLGATAEIWFVPSRIVVAFVTELSLYGFGVMSGRFPELW